MTDWRRDRIVLHGTPHDSVGSLRTHYVQPYVGEPPPTVDLTVRELTGCLVREVVVVYFFAHIDAAGVPHYYRRQAPE